MSEETTSAGYTYWKREIPDSHLLPDCAPKPIERSSSEESLHNRTVSSGSLASKWNAGTTYEEKDITARAKKVLSEIILSVPFGTHSVQPVSSETIFSTGEVHAHIVRGKAKIGYEIETLELRIGDKDTVVVYDLDSTDAAGFGFKKVPRTLKESELRTYVTNLMRSMCDRLLSE